jgi:hypothetical protein
MKTSENDKKLKKMIKGIRLESPGPDFSSKVMESILSGEKILDTGNPFYWPGNSFYSFLQG